MKTRQINLLDGASEIESKNNGENTTITYLSPLWPGKVCFRQILGVWEIEFTDESKLSLVNHDDVMTIGYGNT